MIYNLDYFGFIYKWTNQRNGKYYVGSHYGDTNDGYIGSGMWFKRAYNKNPSEFKREILEYLTVDDHNTLLQLEQRYLIEVCEIGNKDKCYNISRSTQSGWQLHGKTQDEINEIYIKISNTLKNKSLDEKLIALEKARKTIQANPEKYKEAIEKSKQTKKNWSVERKKSMVDRMRNTIENNPDRAKQAVEKCKQTKLKWTKEERQKKLAYLYGGWSDERKKNHKEKLRIKAESRTEEELRKIKENRSKAQKDMDPIKKKLLISQRVATFKRGKNQKDKN